MHPVPLSGCGPRWTACHVRLANVRARPTASRLRLIRVSESTFYPLVSSLFLPVFYSYPLVRAIEEVQVATAERGGAGVRRGCDDGGSPPDRHPSPGSPRAHAVAPARLPVCRHLRAHRRLPVHVHRGGHHDLRLLPDHPVVGDARGALLRHCPYEPKGRSRWPRKPAPAGAAAPRRGFVDP